MSEQLTALTPQQEALTPLYLEKWRAIALCTEPINREQASLAIKNAYAFLGKEEPQFIFFDSQYLALQYFAEQMVGEFGSEVGPQLKREIFDKLYAELRVQLQSELQNKIYNELYNPLYYQIIEELNNHIEEQLQSLLSSQLMSNFYSFLKTQVSHQNKIASELFACSSSWLDFCISELKLECDFEKWEIMKFLVQNCGWIYPFEKTCFVCDRPRVIHFDNENLLHAEAEPAVQYADGFSVYAYHSSRLPETYGEMYPHQWRSQWLLTEENAELRRVLIRGIGYDRICKELQAIEINTWQEYTLLKIDKNIDTEPIYLLKMTCASTGYIHALRVPPDLTSAREAIRWVNWGIDPEEFSVQT